jgi:2-methylcitrate dehydratase
MTTASEALSKYAMGLKYEDLPHDVAHKAKQLLLDTLGCAIGGYLNEPSRLVRAVIREMGGAPESTIIGSGEKTTMANAALANNVMVRFLDFSDIYFNLDPTHPSENIPTVLAVGERERSSGKDIINAVVLAAEINQRFGDTMGLRLKGWHHVTYAGYVVPIVASKLLGLSEQQMVNAVGISGSHNNATGILGERDVIADRQISMMKAAGFGFGAQSGIIGTLLAQKGFTGPNTVIESLNIWAAQKADLTPLVQGSGKFKILETGLKPYAAEFMTHGPLDILYQLAREHDIQPDDVEEIHLRAFSFVLKLSGPDEYDVRTRESADHSMPYCLAVGMIEGDLGPAQYERKQWTDPKVKALMKRVKVTFDPELEKLYPAMRPADVEVRTKSGKSYRARNDYPKGDWRNPMTDQELQRKFRRLADPVIGEKRANEVIETVMDLEHAPDIRGLMSLLVA